VTIGVYPSLLYNVLPFAVDYHPYTAPHIIETLQLLTFTGFGFWLLVNKLSGEATITLDTDWFYRRPARLAYDLCVVPLSRLFCIVESITVNIARLLIRGSTNPVGYLLQAFSSVRCYLAGIKQPNPRPCKPFNPDRYRIPLGVMVLVVLLGFIVIIGLYLLVS
jgi:multicomponent Na+:H+ antiporter subunit D